MKTRPFLLSLILLNVITLGQLVQSQVLPNPGCSDRNIHFALSDNSDTPATSNDRFYPLDQDKLSHVQELLTQIVFPHLMETLGIKVFDEGDTLKAKYYPTQSYAPPSAIDPRINLSHDLFLTPKKNADSLLQYPPVPPERLVEIEFHLGSAPTQSKHYGTPK